MGLTHSKLGYPSYGTECISIVIHFNASIACPGKSEKVSQG